MDSPTVWCPSCGDEYVAGSQFCADCRVALVSERPDVVSSVAVGGAPGGDGALTGLPEGFVELGTWSHLGALTLLRRLEDADLDVAVSWSDPRRDGRAAVAVPREQLDFADAVVREFPVEDDMPSGTVQSYVDRIEARLAEVAMLLDELRSLPGFYG